MIAAFVDQLLNAGDAVVMGLDQIGFGGAAGFDGVRVDGALAQNPAAVEESCCGFEDPLLHLDEFFADDVALLFGIDSAFERGEELRLGVLHLKARWRPRPRNWRARNRFRLRASGRCRRRCHGPAPGPGVRHSV